MGGLEVGRLVALGGALAVACTAQAYSAPTDGAGAGRRARGQDGSDGWVTSAASAPAPGELAHEASFDVTNARDNVRGCAVVGLGEDRLVVGTGLYQQAVLFERDQGRWRCAAQLGGGQWGEGFATSVAVGDEVAVVGAPGGKHGAAYVFERWADGEWRRAARLSLPVSPPVDDGFGFAVAVSGRSVVVGAHRAGLHGPGSGAVFVFEGDRAGRWCALQELVPLDAAPGRSLGYSLAATDRLVAVSAHGQGPEATRGAVYLFARQEDGSWRQEAKLTAADSVEQEIFGVQVSAAPGLVAVASYRPNADRVNCPWVRVFTRLPAGDWQRLPDPPLPGDLRADIKMGLLDDWLVIGAQKRTPQAGGRGSLYPFVRGPDGWRALASRKGGEELGCSVAAAGQAVAAGSYERRPGVSVLGLRAPGEAAGALLNPGYVRCTRQQTPTPPRVRFCGQWLDLDVERVTCGDAAVRLLDPLWRLQRVKVVDLRGSGVSADEARAFGRAHTGVEVIR